MENKGLVRGFGSYTATQLEKTRAELGIRMPISLLARCATYYRNYLKRDPSVEELKLLDLFSARLGTSPGALSLTALASPDEFVLQTYTDCLRKRKTVKPSAPPHPSHTDGQLGSDPRGSHRLLRLRARAELPFDRWRTQPDPHPARLPPSGKKGRRSHSSAFLALGKIAHSIPACHR